MGKELKNKILTQYVPIALILCFFGYKLVEHVINAHMLTFHGKVTTCKITSVETVARTSASVDFTFVYKNKIYKGSSAVDRKFYYNPNPFLNKFFPCIFLESDLTVSEVLIFPDDFKCYNLPFPDSLDWVREYEDYR